MKKVKVMLSFIIVMAILAGVVAFKVKTPDVCAYTKTVSPNPPAATICNLAHAPTTFVTVKTTVGLSTQFATTIPAQQGNLPCPSVTLPCPQFKTLVLE